MDNVFLQAVAESYASDRRLKEVTSNQIFEDLLNFRTNIREPDAEFNFIFEVLEDQGELAKVDILYQFLDTKYCQEDALLLPGLIAAGVAGIAGLYKAGVLDRPIASLFGHYIATLHNIKKRLANTKFFKAHKELSERYAIVEKIMDSNYSQCHQMCAPGTADPQPKDVLKSMAVLFDSNTSKFQYSKNDMQNEQMCTLTCVLDYLSTAIAQLSLIYDRCLTSTGEKNPEINKTVASIVPIGSECSALRDDLAECIKNFNLILSRVYDNNPRIRATWVDILDKKISDVRNNKKISNYGALSMNQSNIHHDYLNFNSDSQGRI